MSPRFSAPVEHKREPTPHLGDGFLIGTAACGLAGVIWWALCSHIGMGTAWAYSSVVVGFIVGQGVLAGTRRGGAEPAVLAAALSAATIFVTITFIDRSLAINEASSAGLFVDIPLWTGAQSFVDTLRYLTENYPGEAAGLLLGPIVALVVASGLLNRGENHAELL